MLDTDNPYKWEFVHGTEAFWAKLNASPDFFYNLHPTRYCFTLFELVAHFKPTILTALPKKGAKDVDRQKRAWVAEKLGTDVKVITCVTSDKPKYASDGAVLIDDRSVNAAAWEKAGGVFILHEGFHTTKSHLIQRGII